jgi:hypothetical protein
MHHVALDRPRAHDRDLDHQIVVAARLQPRQHRHLRARFDLEHADGVGTADHVVNLRIFRRQLTERVVRAAEVIHQRESTLQRRQHAERQQIHFQES